LDESRILIVEDEKIICLDLQRRLEKFGYAVVGIASTAEEAIDKAANLHPDIILMDIMLGEESDGIDAATQIKDLLAIPVIFLTAYADDKTLERAKVAEPFGYVLKPFKERELYTTIDIALYKSGIDKKLARQERWFSGILHGVADGIIATDTENRIEFMNPVAEHLTGWNEDDATDKSLAEVFQVFDNNSEIRLELPTASASGNRRGPLYFEDVFLTNKQGARIHINGTVAPIQVDHGVRSGQAIAFRDVSAIKRMSDTIVYQASHDALTGLINRDEFFSQLDDVARSTLDDGRSHTFAYIDLDQFKIINDVCGHYAGDELLRQVSQAIQDSLREEFVIGRLGGDEFGVVLVDCPLDDAYSQAEGVLEAVRRKFIWQKHSFNVTASIGLVPVTEDQTDGYAILAAADDACYLAKEEGGNGVKIYETANYTFLKRRGEMQWISRLTHALEEDRFVLYFQPIVALKEGETHKKEILLRLQETDGSLVDPSAFIPAAERYNLMPSIDRWVLNAVSLYASRQIELHDECDIFCINISGASVADETFLDFAVGLFERHPKLPSSFCLEVTETAAIENLSRAVEFMNRLKKMGVTFALDDFGNGFSSFAYLKSLPVDYLKLDGSFVRGIDEDPIDRSMVEAVNSIGHVIGMKTIAEFVRNQEIQDIVEGFGVDYIQGFHIAKPAPLARLDEDEATG
jgi:diguanylate cyclase (GGDEF)-like protein/PAS domain S-box-containing protein